MRFKNLSDEERIQKFNQIVDNNRRESETGTNGELTITEYLEKNPEIREVLDTDEVVKYIAYKIKVTSQKLIITILSSLTITPAMLIKGYRMKLSTYLILFILFYFISYLRFRKKAYKSIYMTNKSFIFEKNKKYKKILFKEIKTMQNEGKNYEQVGIYYKKHDNIRFTRIFKNFTINEVINKDQLTEINKLIDEDEHIKESKTKTNGNLTIMEYLKNKHKVLKELDEGEDVKYILYQKKYKIICLLTMSLLMFASMLIIMFKLPIKFSFIGVIIFIGILIILLMLISGVILLFTEVIILTNYSFICINLIKIKKYKFELIESINIKDPPRTGILKYKFEQPKIAEIKMRNKKVILFNHDFQNINLPNLFSNIKKVIIK